VRINETTVLVQTVDFFTPVVDDPYHYGRIAAANSLSDVYAMGGTPVTAMNVVCFPTRKLGAHVLAEILRGGGDTLTQAGVLLAGGHTVEDSEPKFGLAVTGVVDPERVTTKGGARDGDVLILTKPLGTGVLTTAHKREALDDAGLAEAIQWMERLNDVAAQAMVGAGARAATDITGYGLLGHAMEMARASRVTFEIEADAVPLMARVLELRAQGHFPGGSAANRSWLEKAGAVHWGQVEEGLKDVLCDAQTSGGLLVSLPPAAAEQMLAGLDQAWRIGRVKAGTQLLEVV